jgi:hypothetical protein
MFLILDRSTWPRSCEIDTHEGDLQIVAMEHFANDPEEIYCDYVNDSKTKADVIVYRIEFGSEELIVAGRYTLRIVEDPEEDEEC